MLQSAKDHDTTYYTAIMGTTILIAMWLEPMISSGFGDPLPLGTAGILEQAFQFAYLLSTIRILQTLARQRSRITNTEWLHLGYCRQ